MDKHFAAVISGDCVTRHKPHPEGLERLQKHFGCRASEIVMIGDHDYDMAAATAFGAFAVRASWHGQWEDGECEKAARQFRDLDGFLAWIKSAAS